MAIFSILAYLIYITFFALIAYFVIKKAVKDAIRESREEQHKILPYNE